MRICLTLRESLCFRLRAHVPLAAAIVHQAGRAGVTRHTVYEQLQLRRARNSSPHRLLRLKYVAVVSKWPSVVLHEKKLIALLCCSSPAFALASSPSSPSKPNDPHLCLIGSAPFHVYLNPFHRLFCASLAAPGVCVLLFQVYVKLLFLHFCALADLKWGMIPLNMLVLDFGELKLKEQREHAPTHKT